MSLFDRIFGRKVAIKSSDSVDPHGEPSPPIAPDTVSFTASPDGHQAAGKHLMTPEASTPERPLQDLLPLSSDQLQCGLEVGVKHVESSKGQDLPDPVSAAVVQTSTDVDLPNPTESSIRELALLRVTVALRDVLTARLFQDLATSKLEIARLCTETIDRESAAEKIRTEEIEELNRIRFELSRQKKQIAEENERLEKRTQETEMKSRRLAEREATVNKNFSELQRREQLLADQKRNTASTASVVYSGPAADIGRTRDQIESDYFSASKKEAALIEEMKILKARLSSEANAALKKQTLIQEQLNDADRSIQNLLKKNHELENSLKAVRRSSSTPPNKIERKSNDDSTLISVSDHQIIDWMLEDASPEQAEVNLGYLSLIGEGPWPDQRIRELMEEAGFSLCMLPDADVEHIVVGRHSWDASVLEQQIEAMEGRQLRIYSQEMWFAKLATGRDPFDSGDHDLLMAFAKGHPALEYLIDRDVPWPEVSTDELIVGDGVFTEGIEFGVNSPLHNFGYQVGVTSNLSVAQRRALLTKFLEAKVLTFDDDASTEYRSHWGRPRSVQRLFRVASHIKWLIGWQGKSPYRTQANEDWRSDLQWLKKMYYKPDLHKFRWPGV